MIFYKSKAEDGRMVISGTQAEARAVNKQFDQIDIPTDKAGLMAFAQRWADEEFALNKMLDEQSVELVRLSEKPIPTSDKDNSPEVADCAEIVPQLAVSDDKPGSPPPPTISVEIQKDREFTAEIRRQISVEEEIQNCTLPRLASLAANVAWRFEELSKCPSSQSGTT